MPNLPAAHGGMLGGLQPHGSGIALGGGVGGGSGAMPGTALGPRPMGAHRATRLVEKVTLRLLMVAVADTSQTVRMTVMDVLNRTEALDDYLAQVDWASGWGTSGL